MLEHIEKAFEEAFEATLADTAEEAIRNHCVRNSWHRTNNWHPSIMLVHTHSHAWASSSTLEKTFEEAFGATFEDTFEEAVRNNRAETTGIERA